MYVVLITSVCSTGMATSIVMFDTKAQAEFAVERINRNEILLTSYTHVHRKAEHLS